MNPASSTPSTPRMSASGQKACPSLICATQTLKAPIPSPPRSAKRRPDGPSWRAVVGDARHEHDRDDGERDPDQHDRRRHALEEDPGRDRDQRGHDPGDRCHDTHPPDGETVVQRGDPDPAADRGQDAPDHVRGLHAGLADGDGDDGRDGHAHDLRDEDDPEDRRPPREQSAPEVAAAPDDRGEEPEDDGQRLRRADLVQAGAPAGSASTSGSTAVGPSSTTTASAASS